MYSGSDKKMVMDFVCYLIHDTEVPLDVDMAIKTLLPEVIASQSIEQGGKVLEIPNLIYTKIPDTTFTVYRVIFYLAKETILPQAIFSPESPPG